MCKILPWLVRITMTNPTSASLTDFTTKVQSLCLPMLVYIDANLDVGVDIGADVFLGSPDRKIGMILVLISKYLLKKSR